MYLFILLPPTCNGYLVVYLHAAVFMKDALDMYRLEYEHDLKNNLSETILYCFYFI